MINLSIDTCPQDHWQELLSAFSMSNLMQCWEYGEAKAETSPWSIERGVFSDGDNRVGMAQIMVRPLPFGIKGGLAWVNRGPLCKDEYHRPVLESLIAHYVAERHMYLRVAPPLEDGSAITYSGYRSAGTPGWASAILDLTPPIEDIRKALLGKWRNALSKAERSEIEVHSGSDSATFDQFLEQHGRFIGDKGFDTSTTTDLLKALWCKSAPDQKLTVHLGVKDGDFLGAVLIARYGDACEYLAGNTTISGRKLAIGQLLLWRALCDMKAAGCTRMDLGGMDPVTTPKGIYSFKKGLNAAPYRYVSELESIGGGLLSRLVRWRVRRARLAV